MPFADQSYDRYAHVESVAGCSAAGIRKSIKSNICLGVSVQVSRFILFANKSVLSDTDCRKSVERVFFSVRVAEIFAFQEKF